MPGPSWNALPAAIRNPTTAAVDRAGVERNSAGAIASVTISTAWPKLVPVSRRSQFQAISQPASADSAIVLRTGRLHQRRRAKLGGEVVAVPQDGQRDADGLQPKQLRPAGSLSSVEARSVDEHERDVAVRERMLDQALHELHAERRRHYRQLERARRGACLLGEERDERRSCLRLDGGKQVECA